MKLGIFVFGLFVIVTGIVDIAFGALDPAHQPLQTFGDNIPGAKLIAYVLGAALVVGGAAVLRRSTARRGATILTIAYAVVAVLWLPRLVTAPAYVGYTAQVYIGVLSGVCEPVIVIAAALVIYASASPLGANVARTITTARLLAAFSAIVFGLNHLCSIKASAEYVPAWMPLGQPFWVAFTGVAFILSGVAMLIRLADGLAARLLGVMFFVFSAFTLVPGLLSQLHDEASWGGNAYNIVAAASAWILGSWLAAHPRARVAGEMQPAG